jgi:hypothetical protein
MGKSDDCSDSLVKFMHPEGPSPSFHWPQKDDICWVEMESILKVIQALAAGTGRHTFSMKDAEEYNQTASGKLRTRWSLDKSHINMHDMGRHCKLKPCF